MNLRAIVLILLAAVPQSQLVRDASVVPRGTAQIGGIVTTPDAGTERPLRRATVTLSSPELRGSREFTTDDLGRFLFTDLPPGRYLLSAGRLGYIATNYGAKTLKGSGSAVSVADGQRELGLRMSVPKGGVLSGTLTDSAGQPISDARVEIDERRVENGVVTLSRQNPTLNTDDRGVYRAYGLAPGTYLVTVLGLSQPSNPVRQTTPADVQWALAPRQPNSAPPSAPPPSPLQVFARVYFPGVVDSRLATPVSIGLGEEKIGVNFAVQYVPVVRVSGVLVRPDGRPPGGLTVTLQTADASGNLPGPPARSKTATISGSGEFAFEAVEPGSYVITSNLGTQNGSFWWREAVEVAGRDVTGVAVLPHPAVTTAGRVVTAADATAAPPNFSRVRVEFRSLSSNGGTMTNPSADGTFSMTSLNPGPYRLAVTISQAGLTAAEWTVQSIAAGGRDVFDRAVDLPPGGSLDNILVTLTDKISSLSGKLLDDRGQPAPEYTVVVFPVSPDYWVQGLARAPRRARPANDGQFQFPNMPPGEYYVAAAMDASASDLSTASFLQDLIPAAIKLTIVAGENKVQDFKIK